MRSRNLDESQYEQRCIVNVHKVYKPPEILLFSLSCLLAPRAAPCFPLLSLPIFMSFSFCNIIKKIWVATSYRRIYLQSIETNTTQCRKHIFLKSINWYPPLEQNGNVYVSPENESTFMIIMHLLQLFMLFTHASLFIITDNVYMCSLFCVCSLLLEEEWNKKKLFQLNENCKQWLILSCSICELRAITQSPLTLLSDIVWRISGIRTTHKHKKLYRNFITI